MQAGPRAKQQQSGATLLGKRDGASVLGNSSSCSILDKQQQRDGFLGLDAETSGSGDQQTSRLD